MSKDLQIIKELESRFGEIEYTINNNKKATDLIIEFKGVETKDLELIGELTSLEWLHLSGNKITSIQNLSKLINLKGLFICENQITTILNVAKKQESPIILYTVVNSKLAKFLAEEASKKNIPFFKY